MPDRLSEQIAALPSLKDPPPQLHKRLMVALLAYRIQEREFGGLSHAARRRLQGSGGFFRNRRTVPRQRRFCPSNRHETPTGVARRNTRRSSPQGMAIYIEARLSPACPGSPGRLQGHGGPDLCSLGSGSHDRSGSLRRLYPQIFRRVWSSPSIRSMPNERRVKPTSSASAMRDGTPSPLAMTMAASPAATSNAPG